MASKNLTEEGVRNNPDIIFVPDHGMNLIELCIFIARGYANAPLLYYAGRHRIVLC